MLFSRPRREGMDDMRAAAPAVRERLDAQAAQIGWPAMHALLAQVDPATAARLAPADSQRIQRALEVWHVSGKPLSSFHTRSGKNESWTADRKSTRLNSSHSQISYAVFCL